MDGRFDKYPDVTWDACAAAQFIGMGDEIQTKPDLEHFRLKRFKDLRKHHIASEKRSSKIMMIDDRSKTNIFIDGPDNPIDRMLERLPHYKDRSWVEIRMMSLEKDSSSCENAHMSECDPQIREMIGWKSLGETDKPHNEEEERRICAACENYKYKGGS